MGNRFSPLFDNGASKMLGWRGNGQREGAPQVRSHAGKVVITKVVGRHEGFTAFYAGRQKSAFTTYASAEDTQQQCFVLIYYGVISNP